MTHETPAQRRTRLIEQYVLEYLRKNTPYTSQDAILVVAESLADAVIAATPQETTRYPSEIETRLIEALERVKQLLQTRCYKTALELVELTLQTIPPGD